MTREDIPMRHEGPPPSNRAICAATRLAVLVTMLSLAGAMLDLATGVVEEPPPSRDEQRRGLLPSGDPATPAPVWDTLSEHRSDDLRCSTACPPSGLPGSARQESDTPPLALF